MESLLKPFTTIIIIFFFSSIFPLSRGEEEDEKFRECSRPYECGEIRNLAYPFWGGVLPYYCGLPGFEVSCKENKSYIKFDHIEFQLLNLSHSDQMNTIRVARVDLLEGPCSSKVKPEKTTLSDQYDLFIHYPRAVQNLTLFYCDPLPPPRNELASFPHQFSCPEISKTVLYANDSLVKHLEWTHVLEWLSDKCSVVQVPIFLDGLNESRSPVEDGMKAVGEALKRGFDINYSELIACRACEASGGKCGALNDHTSLSFRCFCPHGTELGSCPPPRHRGPNVTLKIIIGVSAAFAAVAVMSVIFFLYLWRRNRKQYVPSTMLFRNISSDVSSGKDVEKSTYLGVHVFSYEELVEATKNFDSAKELGDGGFGTVYYGELRDGRAVAVKRLYESNCRRVEQFMNEVEILAHLRHKNLVSLYGCTSRQSHELLLVYEYIPNGTVADHLHGERARPGALPWHIRLNIAIETACALSYLHASEIVHRDVKTNNILLDNNFSVKVADFGLSRLFPMHVTHVSTAPQGTPGYVDPEYHQCYQLTSKSDVFSFGVVLMELVSSMPAVDITRHRHDINLSTMAMNRIQNGTLHELVDPCLGFNSDSRVKKMITAVAELAFQCLQHEKDMRPPMVDVLEELKAIQSRDFETEKAEKNDSITDEAVLLNSGPLTLSPDTVTINWSSRNTTPNASG